MTGWAPPRIVAAYTARPVATIRRWAATGQVPTLCCTQTRRLLVHAPTARTIADQRQRRAAA